MIKGCRNHIAFVERKIRVDDGFWKPGLIARFDGFFNALET